MAKHTTIDLAVEPKINSANMINEDLWGSVSQNLSKAGDFSLFRSRLEAVADSLTKTQVRDVYCFLRNNSKRWESEWRPEFLELFHITDADLPNIDDADRWSLILHHLVSAGDLQKVREFVEGIGVPSWN